MRLTPEALVSIANALAFAFPGLYLLKGYRAHREHRTYLFYGMGLTIAALPHILAALPLLGFVAQDHYALLAFPVINHVALALLLTGTLLLVTGRRAVYLGLPTVYERPCVRPLGHSPQGSPHLAHLIASPAF